MGILNLTPDSFSDGLPQASLQDFLSKAEQLITDGAHIIDIGGESTRPNADEVDLDEEKKRILPFLEQFRKKHPEYPISLDSKKYDVVKAALPYGIQVINDVSFMQDERILSLANDANSYYVLMHSRGDSQSMMQQTQYEQGVAKGLQDELGIKLKQIRLAGFPQDKLIIDLGFGFAKTPKQCVELMESLSLWQQYELPLMLGISRKTFIQEYTGPCEPLERDNMTMQLTQKAVQAGFQIIRTHNVALTVKELAIRGTK